MSKEWHGLKFIVPRKVGKDPITKSPANHTKCKKLGLTC